MTYMMCVSAELNYTLYMYFLYDWCIDSVYTLYIYMYVMPQALLVIILFIFRDKKLIYDCMTDIYAYKNTVIYINKQKTTLQ